VIYFHLFNFLFKLKNKQKTNKSQINQPAAFFYKVGPNPLKTWLEIYLPLGDQPLPLTQDNSTFYRLGRES